MDISETIDKLNSELIYQSLCEIITMGSVKIRNSHPPIGKIANSFIKNRLSHKFYSHFDSSDSFFKNNFIWDWSFNSTITLTNQFQIISNFGKHFKVNLTCLIRIIINFLIVNGFKCSFCHLQRTRQDVSLGYQFKEKMYNIKPSVKMKIMQ